MTLHVHCPPSVYERRVQFCPTCDCRRRFVGLVAVWYSTTWTCCGCGDSWDGESGLRMPRPFARGWRQREIRLARQRWAEGLSPAEVRAWLADRLAEEVAWSEANEAVCALLAVARAVLGDSACRLEVAA